MLWGSRKEEAPKEAPQEPIKRGKLSPQLQKIVDRDDQFYDDVYSP
jgi:fission process protein 1